MPTFGKTDIGTAQFNNFPTTNSSSVCRFTLTEPGVLNKLTIYYKGTSVSPLHEAGLVRGVVYDVVSGEPDTLVAETTPVNSPTTDGWIDFPFSPPVELPAGDYYLGAHSATRKIGAMDTAGTNRTCTDTYSDGALVTWPIATDATSTQQKSIYATYGLIFNAEPGAYAITGKADGGVAGRVVNAAVGAYAITGKAAELGKGFLLDAAKGVYAIVGSAIESIATRILPAIAGSYALTGSAAPIVAGRVISADQGTYIILGQDAVFVFVGFNNYVLILNTGSYIVSGNSTTLDQVTPLREERGLYHHRRRH